MSSRSDSGSGYAVPRYRAEGDPAYFHVLHGTVPDHQIDFIYAPEVPQQALTHTHFAHLTRLIKFMEPRETASYAFTLGNLSRDDVQHEPGRGGLSLIFALRAEGVLDQAGRAMPPFAHGILAVDRAFDEASLLAAMTAFHGGFARENMRGQEGFYHAYVRATRRDPEAVAKLLAAYVAGFRGLPAPSPGGGKWHFTGRGGAPPRRVTIVHLDDAPFRSLAGVMARLGSVLHRSDLKWTAITNGREPDVPGGLCVCLVPESEAPAAHEGLSLRLDEVPADEVAIARELFGATPVNGAPGAQARTIRIPFGACPAEGEGERTARAPATAPRVPLWVAAIGAVVTAALATWIAASVLRTGRPEASSVPVGTGAAPSGNTAAPAPSATASAAATPDVPAPASVAATREPPASTTGRGDSASPRGTVRGGGARKAAPAATNKGRKVLTDL